MHIEKAPLGANLELPQTPCLIETDLIVVIFVVRAEALCYVEWLSSHFEIEHARSLRSPAGGTLPTRTACDG
jgi:hypothetical protein